MGKRKWTPGMISWLNENNLRYTRQELTERFNSNFPGENMTIKAVSRACQRYVDRLARDSSRLSSEEAKWLELNHSAFSIGVLTAKFNQLFAKKKKSSTMSQYCVKLGLRKNNVRHLFSEQEIIFLREYYPKKSVDEFIRMFYEEFGVMLSYDQIIQCAKRNKVKATYAHKEHARKASLARTKSVGTEHYDGSKNIIMVKVPEGKFGNKTRDWVNKKNVVWEASHGTIPKGMHVIQLDGDGVNYDEDNLMLVSTYVLRRFRIYNSHHPASSRELVRTYVMAWQLMEAINGGNNNDN